MRVISNTTVLSNFARVGALALLQHLFTPLYLPPEVYTEIQAAQAEGYPFFDGIEQQIAPFTAGGWLQLVSMDEPALRVFGALPAKLHQGERACLAIAHQGDWLVLTDDRAARAEAQRRSIAISGSIGWLVLSVERGHTSLDHANHLLAQMVTYGYHTPLSDLVGLVKPDRPV